MVVRGQRKGVRSMTEKPRVWAIKLGSGGRCVPFCEKRGIVGVGWQKVDPSVLRARDQGALRQHLRSVYAYDARALGSASGQLWRFAHECKIGDYIFYYDPPRRRVQVTRVTSDLQRRDFDDAEDVDIWLYRKVELGVTPFKVVDFYGGLKGRILGPRMSFWELRGAAEVAAQLFSVGAVQRGEDAELTAAYEALSRLVLRRMEGLDASDWEWLVTDYFIAQGAHVDERRVGGSQATIDLEARFDHGELGEEVWRVQVKRLSVAVDERAVKNFVEHAGECDRRVFVSARGFTDVARQRAEEDDVTLLEAQDFTRFLLSGKLRARLREKLHLPFWSAP